jgi:hypothetical protein
MNLFLILFALTTVSVIIYTYKTQIMKQERKIAFFRIGYMNYSISLLWVIITFGMFFSEVFVSSLTGHGFAEGVSFIINGPIIAWYFRAMGKIFCEAAQ